MTAIGSNRFWHILTGYGALSLPLLMIAVSLDACSTPNMPSVRAYPTARELTAPAPDGTIPTEAGNLLAEAWQAVRKGQCDLAASKVRELGPYLRSDPSGLMHAQGMDLVVSIESCEAVAGVAGRGPIAPEPPPGFRGAPPGIYRISSGPGKTIAEFQADLRFCEQFNSIPEQGIACEIDRGNTVYDDKTGAAYSRERLQAALPIPIPTPPPPRTGPSPQRSPEGPGSGAPSAPPAQPLIPLENPIGTLFELAVQQIPAAAAECGVEKLIFGGGPVVCVAKNVVIHLVIALGEGFVKSELCSYRDTFLQISLISVDVKRGIVADACD
jgi:hypothetical protein